MKKIILSCSLILLFSCTINNTYNIVIGEESCMHKQISNNDILPSALNENSLINNEAKTRILDKKSELSGEYKLVQIKGYYRKDGTYIKPHTRKVRISK